jgi:hypothetical protein
MDEIARHREEGERDVKLFLVVYCDLERRDEVIERSIKGEAFFVVVWGRDNFKAQFFLKQAFGWNDGGVVRF